MQPCPIKYSSMRSVTFLWVSSANPANDEPVPPEDEPDQAAQHDEQQRAEPEPLYGGCQPFRARRNHLEAQAGLNVLFELFRIPPEVREKIVKTALCEAVRRKQQAEDDNEQA